MPNLSEFLLNLYIIVRYSPYHHGVSFTLLEELEGEGAKSIGNRHQYVFDLLYLRFLLVLKEQDKIKVVNQRP